MAKSKKSRVEEAISREEVALLNEAAAPFNSGAVVDVASEVAKATLEEAKVEAEAKAEVEVEAAKVEAEATYDDDSDNSDESDEDNPAKEKDWDKIAEMELNVGKVAFRKGEKGFLIGRINAGIHWGKYIRARFQGGLNDRKVAIACLEAIILPLANDWVSPDILIGCAASFSFMKEKEIDGYDLIPWHLHRDVWSKLFVWENFASKDERMIPLPGMEEEIVELMKRHSASRSSDARTAAKDDVRRLHKRHADNLEAERKAKESLVRKAREEEAAKRLEAERAANEERKAIERLEAQRAEKERLEREALQNEALKEAAKEAAKRFASRQIELVNLEAERKAKEDEERKAREEADKEAARLAELAKAATDAGRKSAQMSPRPKTEDKDKGGKMPLPESYKDSPAKDVACMISTIIRVHAQPEFVLRALVADLVATSKDANLTRIANAFSAQLAFIDAQPEQRAS